MSLDLLSERLMARLSTVLREHFTLLIDERQTRLGRAFHVETVIRRMRRNEPGAIMLDGHYLLTPEAHAEELALRSEVTRQGRALEGR